MAALTGVTIANSYKDLLQVSNSNSGVDATLRVVSDGEDTAAALQLSTTVVASSATLRLNHADSRGVNLTTRPDITTYPVMVTQPRDTNLSFAFDITPSGNAPVENANGFTWVDVCSADPLLSAAIAVSRVACTSTRAEFGSYSYGGAAELPVWIQCNGTVQIKLSTTGIAFYGIAPVARQLLATGAGATVDNVITALQNLGLVKQS